MGHARLSPAFRAEREAKIVAMFATMTGRQIAEELGLTHGVVNNVLYKSASGPNRLSSAEWSKRQRERPRHCTLPREPDISEDQIKASSRRLLVALRKHHSHACGEMHLPAGRALYVPHGAGSPLSNMGSPASMCEGA